MEFQQGKDSKAQSSQQELESTERQRHTDFSSPQQPSQTNQRRGPEMGEQRFPTELHPQENLEETTKNQGKEDLPSGGGPFLAEQRQQQAKNLGMEQQGNLGSKETGQGKQQQIPGQDLTPKHAIKSTEKSGEHGKNQEHELPGGKQIGEQPGQFENLKSQTTQASAASTSKNLDKGNQPLQKHKQAGESEHEQKLSGHNKKRIPDCKWVTLNDGKTKMPVFGLGTYRMEPGETTQVSVERALRMGYRHIDTAHYYNNEEDVGEAIKNSGLRREDIFVTTKMPTKEKSPGNPREHAISCVNESLKKLGLDYLDLYLLHTPHQKEQRLERWRGLIQCVKDGKIRAIGVSNFGINHLKELLNEEIIPAINQIEVNPFLSREDLRSFCKEHNIKVEAYSPLAQARKFGDDTLKKIAQKHKITEAQVMIRWCLQHDLLCIMKSESEERLLDNAAALSDNCKLDDEDMQELDELDEHYVISWHISEIP